VERIPDWRGLGDNAVVLEFWGTWCAPCVAAIPHLNDLAERFKDRPVRFLAITDEEDWRVRNFLKLKPMASWIGLDAGRATFTAYGVEPLPRTFLINRQHLIAAVTTPEAVTPELLEEVLGGVIHPSPTETQPPQEPSDNNLLFEAVVRPSGPAFDFKRTATSFMAKGIGLRQLIATAYASPPRHVLFDSPLANTTYEVSLKVPQASAAQLNQLLQQIISAACEIQVTRETRDTGVYILKAGTAAAKLRRVDGPEKPITAGAGQIVSRGTPLKYFAMVLEGTVGRPVVDETDIVGLVDLSLYWDAKDPQSALAAVRDQLGLDIGPGTRPVDMLVVKTSTPPHQ